MHGDAFELGLSRLMSAFKGGLDRALWLTGERIGEKPL